MANKLDEILQLLRSGGSQDRLNGWKRWVALEDAGKLAGLERVAADASVPPDARANALDLLGKEGPIAKPAIVARLPDPEATVRAAAAEALAWLDPDDFASRAAALFEDASPWVRRVVLQRSNRVKDRAALLRRGLRDPEPALRVLAAGEVSWLPSQGWPEPLAEAFRSLAGNVRAEGAVARALFCSRDAPDFAAAVTPLVPRLLELAGDEDAYDPDNDLQAGRFAAELLAVTGAPKAQRPALEAALRREGLDPYVRKQLELARKVQAVE